MPLVFAFDVVGKGLLEERGVHHHLAWVFRWSLGVIVVAVAQDERHFIALCQV